MLGGEGGNTVGLILLVAGLGLVPFVVVTTTAFMKIAVVLFLIRNALGIQQTPPNLVLYGIAIVLAVFLTSPVIGAVYAELSDRRLDYENFEDWEVAAERARVPIQEHLLKFTDEPARNFFYEATAEVWPEEAHEAASSDDLMILIPAFVISELTRAFEIGFLLYLPVHRHRPDHLQHPPCHGHDDGLAAGDLRALQAVPVRPGGRLVPPAGGPGLELPVAPMGGVRA